MKRELCWKYNAKVGEITGRDDRPAAKRVGKIKPYRSIGR